ncbi:MAG: DEAD/DEAH box helicase, partial [Caecibacter massiliensis]|nr:DEAD/DEAH box helicase [Caecibacter massiliensis]
ENAGKAKLLLDRLIKRKEMGLATARQIRLLEGRGFQHVGTWSFEAARKLIGRIAACGWRMPAGIIPSQYQPD